MMDKATLAMVVVVIEMLMVGVLSGLVVMWV